ncbi:MAG TPA: hypothetical protein PK103_08305 [Elusimicrobiales bacterium]|nr:hypothetical protein [Elusimicrobiales bacterium]HOL63349.1 hypothetical protein [Elusimicrobiales bacterium]HPO95489.1 hypothetical protein [Elusimicrobiales bacterium]
MENDLSVKEKINDIKFFVFPTVFGVMWGIFEMIIGSYLHMIRFPLRGALMAGFGAVFMCVLRSYVNRKGVNLIAGFCAICVKLFSYGGFKIGPVVGIAIESFIFEIVFSLFSINRFSILISSFLAVLEGIPHFFITTWIIYGGGIFDAYLNAISEISRIFGLSKEFYLKVLVLWISGHIIIALFSFFISLKLIKWLKNEMA